jgi:N-acetylneuraminate synthase
MSIIIGGKNYSKNNVFVIAEIGNNHNGSIERAKEMVVLAKDMGANCAKFQMRHLDQVYRKRSLSKDGEDLGTEYILDLLEKFELTVEQHKELSDFCKEIGISYLCTPWDVKSVDVLMELEVPCFKVASADLTNLSLLEKLIQTKKPLVLSTGMSTDSEINQVVNLLNSKGVEFCLLHCNSTYPAPFRDINLKWMESLKKIHSNIGYSGHERGVAVSLAAMAFGPCVIERHFTLDRSMEGPDHAASLEFGEFKLLIEGIRELEQAIGSSGTRKFSQGELINRENLGKSLVSSRKIKKGETIRREDILVKSPGQGLSPLRINDLVGKVTIRNIEEEDFFYSSDLGDESSKPRSYTFDRSWGVPVRYHDFDWYSKNINPGNIEFHLSYSDMKLQPTDYLSGTYNFELVVHAPELFEGSHLMDLTSPDGSYRKISLKETQKVIDITRDLKRFFPKTSRPKIIANIGGFSMDKNLSKEEKTLRYKIFGESLKQLDMEGVELLPQTMAPFPWHFGGQRYQNLFVEIDEILFWCKEYDLRMCFDVSHSKLTCNHFGYDFYEFSRKIAPYTAHLHLGDASGVNGEGLQVGEGEIDFKLLGKILREGCPEATFIPEIWQGHKNFGEGFWKALDQLEGMI